MKLIDTGVGPQNVGGPQNVSQLKNFFIFLYALLSLMCLNPSLGIVYEFQTCIAQENSEKSPVKFLQKKTTVDPEQLKLSYSFL